MFWTISRSNVDTTGVASHMLEKVRDRQFCYSYDNDSFGIHKNVCCRKISLKHEYHAMGEKRAHIGQQSIFLSFSLFAFSLKGEDSLMKHRKL